MNDVSSFLAEWTVSYLKNKDILAKRIESIEKDKNGFNIIVNYSDRINFFVIMPIINDITGLIKKMNDKEAHYGLVTLNNRLNLDFLVKNWNALSEFRNLCIYFVNPFSQLDKKWLVFPYTHSRVCDESLLASGLKAIFDTVEPITEEDAKARLKQGRH